MPDTVSFLEADLKAILMGGWNREVVQQ